MVFLCMLCHLHVCCCLELSIDHYCIRFFEAADWGKGLDEWNVLQALLRRSAHTVEGCFLSVSTGVLCVLLLSGAELYNVRIGPNFGLTTALWAGWVLPPTALVFYAVFRSASITEKCNRVPALVNSWSLTVNRFDHQKEYVVAYIMHSAAGFYVKGVRLNATWALKLSYLFGALIFTMTTQAVLKYG